MLSSYLRDYITREILDFVCSAKCRKREKIRLVVFVLMCPKLSRRKFGFVSMTKKIIKMFQWKAVMIAGLHGVARRRIQRMLVARRNPTHHVHLLDPADKPGCGICHNDFMRLRLLPFSTFVDRIRE